MIERIAPGVYIEERGPDGRVLHLDVPALLTHFGYGDTPTNRETLVRVAAKVFRERYPTAPLVAVERHE